MKNIEVVNTDSKELVLPENIKEEIKKGVAELKELLKDDQEFLQNLVWKIVNGGKYLQLNYIADSVYHHYTNVIEQCQKEYKAWPIEINKIRDIVYKLSSIATGYNELIFDVLKTVNPEYTSDDCKALGDIARKEIGSQFNPEINYNCEEVELKGARQELNPDLDSDFY